MVTVATAGAPPVALVIAPVVTPIVANIDQSTIDELRAPLERQSGPRRLGLHGPEGDQSGDRADQRRTHRTTSQPAHGQISCRFRQGISKPGLQRALQFRPEPRMNVRSRRHPETCRGAEGYRTTT